MGTDEKKKGLDDLINEAASRTKENMARPTSQMSPNPVLPYKRQNPALTGEMPQQKGGNKVATQETAPQLDSYDKMLEYMKANQIADADAGVRARRREMMAAIGDGISAVSSLYQTTKGAPVTYTPGADMSKVMRDRYDRMTAQRKADSDKYLNYLKVQQAKEQAEATKAYHTQQLAETKRYHDAAIARDEDRTEAIRMKNFITAGADAAYNDAYNDAVTNQGMSEDQAEAYAQQAYDAKVSELFNEWSEREKRAAQDKSDLQQKQAKKAEQQGNAAESRASTAKQEAARKQQKQNQSKSSGKGGSTKKSPTGGGGNNSSKKSKKKSPTAK